MFKQIVCNTALTMALLLAVFMFGSCVVPDVPDNGLAAYKSAVQAELEAYAEEKGEDNYTVENWAAIKGFAAGGKAAVGAAADRAGVDAAAAAAKEEIDTVWRLGTFYSLQEAYDEGLLTREDLYNIAYYHNGGVKYVYDESKELFYETHDNVFYEGYVPLPKNPETLSAETEKAIREAGAYFLPPHKSTVNVTADDITLLEYCGTYNNCVAVMIYNRHALIISPGAIAWVYADGYDDPFLVYGDVIANIVFFYSNTNEIIIYKFLD